MGRLETRFLHLGIFKIVFRRRGGEIKIQPGILGYAKISVGAGILDAVEGFAEHGVMRLLAIEQEIDGLTDALIVDLAVEIFVDHFGALFAGDIGKQVCAEIACNGNVIRSPGIAGGVDEPRV